MSVAEVQQRIALIQATTRGFAPQPVNTAASFKSVFDKVTNAQSTTDYGLSGNKGSDAVDLASTFMGTPYVWGGESPKGFDCSGLVQYVYKQLGVDLPRHSSDQAKAGVPVAIADLKKGDLVFFGSPVDHVGIYAGDGKMVVAPHTGDALRVGGRQIQCPGISTRCDGMLEKFPVADGRSNQGRALRRIVVRKQFACRNVGARGITEQGQPITPRQSQ